MKAHEYFLINKLTPSHRDEMQMYSHLIGKKVNAICTKEGPEDANLEDETFTVVAFTAVQASTKLHAVLKSDISAIAILVPIDYINKERYDFCYNPGYLLRTIEE